MREIRLTRDDQLIYRDEIRPFLPERVFDAHCHLLIDQFHPRLAETMPLAMEEALGEVDLPYLSQWWRALLPDARVEGMLMGFPTADVDIEKENEFVAQSASEAGFPFALMVRPQMNLQQLESDIQRLKPTTLKPYMVFVEGKEPNSASITDIIPEEQIALADRHGLAVVLHVAKPRGMADSGNLDEIERLVGDYPNCKFVLAHCGRCFITPNMEVALDRLPRAKNLWLDTSAVCDMGVFMTLINRFDLGRIVFGTDLVTAAGFRGSYVRLGMSWHLCTAEMLARAGGTADRSTFAAYESLAALCHAMKFGGLTDRERRAVFHDNALELFGPTRVEPLCRDED